MNIDSRALAALNLLGESATRPITPPSGLAGGVAPRGAHECAALVALASPPDDS
ncbi:MAG: hypothetical protein LBE78_01870 [Burkholderiaceae bacterium]|jgi:hypothetical protein|nr:hypothetical protein [Burkholderiaceae bacterium]